jgi:hypothetical protein
MQRKKVPVGLTLVAMFGASLLAASAAAQTETVLYNFDTNSQDGCFRLVVW